MRIRGGEGQRPTGAGRKAWGGGGGVCKDRFSVEVGAGDISVRSPRIAGVDCFGGQQTGGVGMVDMVCMSHVNKLIATIKRVR